LLFPESIRENKQDIPLLKKRIHMGPVALWLKDKRDQFKRGGQAKGEEQSFFSGRSYTREKLLPA